jgi:hypothetical protein
MGEFRPSKPGERRGGRQKGTPNKATADIKAALLEALDDEEHGGAAGYFKWLAKNNSAAFSGLIGKVLPTTLEHSGGLQVKIGNEFGDV